MTAETFLTLTLIGTALIMCGIGAYHFDVMRRERLQDDYNPETRKPSLQGSPATSSRDKTTVANFDADITRTDLPEEPYNYENT